MQKAKGLRIGLSIFALVSALSVHAAPGEPPPTAFLEYSKIIGIGKKINITSVPTQDINGSVRYLDLEITLNVNDEGIVDAATVISAESPQLLTQGLIAGNHQDASGNQCTLTIGLAHEGRKAVVMNCTDINGNTWSASLYTGPIVGHLFEQELVRAGIDQIPGHENLIWGQVINETAHYFLSCYGGGNLIGANQVGNILTITNYASDNLVDCGHNCTLVEP